MSQGLADRLAAMRQHPHVLPRRAVTAAASAVVALATTVALAVSSAPAHAQTDAGRYIVECERAWTRSTVTGDTTDVVRCVADDFVGISTSGERYDKRGAVGEARASRGLYRSNHLDEVKVRFYGNTAVAQGAETWERRAGEPRRGRWIWTDTWVLRDGRWQVVAAEDVSAPAPTVAAPAGARER